MSTPPTDSAATSRRSSPSMATLCEEPIGELASRSDVEAGKTGAEDDGDEKKAQLSETSDTDPIWVHWDGPE